MGNGRDGYMLVNLISALQFISSIDASCLSINPLDYQLQVFAGEFICRMYAASQETIHEAEYKRLSIFWSCL